MHNFWIEIRFATRSSSINSDFLYWFRIGENFEIELVCKDEEQEYKVRNLKKYLEIESLYKEHKDYVRDIIRNAVIYNESRVNELLEQFPDLFQSRAEILNSVFMSYIDKESWGKRPLSKLTHDIYEEFKIKSSK